MATTKYTSLDYKSGETVIDHSVAFVQAAQALDIAAENAVASKDGEALFNIASLWIRMGESLGETEQTTSETPNKLGFHVDKGDIAEIE